MLHSVLFIYMKIWDGEKRALFVAISVYILCFALTATTAFEWEAVVTSNQTELFHKSVNIYYL